MRIPAFLLCVSARRADLIDALLSAAAARQALSPQGLRTLGLAQEAEGKLDLARATLENAFAADPKSVVLLEDLSRVAQAAGDYKGALGYIAHARDLEPDNAHLAYEFGTICARMGLLGEARKANAEALKLDPENADYNLGMGTIVSFSSDPSQAIPYLMKYQAKHPQDPAGMLILGEAYYRGKDFESATAWLKRAVPHASTAAGGALLSWQDCSSGESPRRGDRRTQSVSCVASRSTRSPGRAGPDRGNQAGILQAAGFFDRPSSSTPITMAPTSVCSSFMLVLATPGVTSSRSDSTKSKSRGKNRIARLCGPSRFERPEARILRNRSPQAGTVCRSFSQIGRLTQTGIALSQIPVLVACCSL